MAAYVPPSQRSEGDGARKGGRSLSDMLKKQQDSGTDQGPDPRFSAQRFSGSRRPNGNRDQSNRGGRRGYEQNRGGYRGEQQQSQWDSPAVPAWQQQSGSS